jgi:hypothetical protein
LRRNFCYGIYFNKFHAICKGKFQKCDHIYLAIHSHSALIFRLRWMYLILTSFKRFESKPVVKIIYIYTHCNLWRHRQFIAIFYQFLHIRIEIAICKGKFQKCDHIYLAIHSHSALIFRLRCISIARKKILHLREELQHNTIFLLQFR